MNFEDRYMSYATAHYGAVSNPFLYTPESNESKLKSSLNIEEFRASGRFASEIELADYVHKHSHKFHNGMHGGLDHGQDITIEENVTTAKQKAAKKAQRQQTLVSMSKRARERYRQRRAA